MRYLFEFIIKDLQDIETKSKDFKLNLSLDFLSVGQIEIFRADKESNC